METWGTKVDFDGDTLQCTTNETMMKAHTQQKPVKCATKNGTPVQIKNDEPLIECAKVVMGKNTPKIGKVINDATQIFTIRGRFDKDSEEYKELTNRLIQMQKISQSVIDAKKTADWFNAPEFWFKRGEIEFLPLDEQEKAHNLCADKKPYFFIVENDSLRKEYKEMLEQVEIRTAMRWGLSSEQFLNMDTALMDEEQLAFYNKILEESPINMNDTSSMYVFTKTVEEELGKLNGLKKKDQINCSELLKFENVQCDTDRYTGLFKDVKKLVEDYIDDKDSKVSNLRKKALGEDKFKMKELIHEINVECYDIFKMKLLGLTSGDLKLAINVLIDVLYETNKSTLVLWDVFSTELIKNLLEKNGNMVNVLEQDVNGDFSYKGRKFVTKKVQLEF